MGKQMVPYTVIPNDQLGKFLLVFPTTLIKSVGLEVLVSEQGVHLPEDGTNIPLNWKLPLDTLGV